MAAGNLSVLARPASATRCLAYLKRQGQHMSPARLSAASSAPTRPARMPLRWSASAEAVAQNAESCRICGRRVGGPSPPRPAGSPRAPSAPRVPPLAGARKVTRMPPLPADRRRQGLRRGSEKRSRWPSRCWHGGSPQSAASARGTHRRPHPTPIPSPTRHPPLGGTEPCHIEGRCARPAKGWGAAMAARHSPRTLQASPSLTRHQAGDKLKMLS